MPDKKPKIIKFNEKSKSDYLRIELPNCIVNIRLGKTKKGNEKVTHIEIFPDSNNTINTYELDGNMNNRVITHKKENLLNFFNGNKKQTS